MTTTPAAADHESIAAAHARLVQDPSLQFDLVQPKAPAPPPEWLHWLGDVLKALSPVLTWVFWGGLAIVAALILFYLGREALRLRFNPKAKAAKATKPAPQDWRPTQAAAVALLGDADALAAQQRYAEAAHLLLLRSINDMDSRRPRAVRPALTARDIAALDAMPEAARPAFTLIARVVERSLFGGAPVDAPGYADCRAAYENFALPAGWAR
jgi:hypothetical protein